MVRTVRFCPALPKILYRPVQLEVRGGNIATKINELLKNRGSVVITGPDHQSFKNNTNIGKTSLVHRELIPLLKQEGRSVSFTDVSNLVDPEVFLFYYPSYNNENRLKDSITNIPLNCDVYIFDEIHLIFPDDNFYKKLLSAAYFFWEKVEDLANRGKKIVYITARHPLNPDFHETFLLPGMKSFWTAPVVELINSSKPWL